MYNNYIFLTHFIMIFVIYSYDHFDLLHDIIEKLQPTSLGCFCSYFVKDNLFLFWFGVCYEIV